MAIVDVSQILKQREDVYCKSCNDCIVECSLVAVALVSKEGQVKMCSLKAKKFTGLLDEVWSQQDGPRDTTIDDPIVGAVDVIVRKSKRSKDEYIVYFVAGDEREFFHSGLIDHLQSNIYFDEKDSLSDKISWSFHPSKMLTGDFFSWFTNAGSTYIFMGDVEGGGITAGLYATYVLGLIESSVLHTPSVEDAMYVINRLLVRKGNVKRVSLLVAEVWDKKARFYSAGGTPPIIRGSEMSPMINESTPLGIRDGFRASYLGDTPNDFLLFTDGIYETVYKGAIHSSYWEWLEFVYHNPSIWVDPISGLLNSYMTNCNVSIVDDATIIRVAVGGQNV